VGFFILDPRLRLPKDTNFNIITAAEINRIKNDSIIGPENV